MISSLGMYYLILPYVHPHGGLLSTKIVQKLTLFSALSAGVWLTLDFSVTSLVCLALQNDMLCEIVCVWIL